MRDDWERRGRSEGRKSNSGNTDWKGAHRLHRYADGDKGHAFPRITRFLLISVICGIPPQIRVLAVAVLDAEADTDLVTVADAAFRIRRPHG